jgi:hypothetical protein
MRSISSSKITCGSVPLAHVGPGSPLTNLGFYLLTFLGRSNDRIHTVLTTNGMRDRRERLIRSSIIGVG